MKSVLQKHYKITETAIFASITLASLFYTGFLISEKFVFRIVSFVFVALFYLFTLLFTLERRVLFAEQFRKTGKKVLFLYILLLFIPLAYSVSPNSKNLLTLFFHPLAFLAYFMAFVALTVQENTVEALLKFSRVMNFILPFAIIFDLMLFKAPTFVNDLNYFLLVEILFLEKLSVKRKIYLFVCIAAIVVIEVIYGNRMIALRQLAVVGVTISFLIIPFLKARFLRFTVLLVGICILYLLSFHFEQTFQFIANNIPSAKIDTTDTRSFLYDEFFETFKGADWIGGRGYMGTYFSPWFYNWQGDDGDYFQRFSLEVGVLEILLKGGLLLLVPFYFIFIKALFKGFVRSEVNSVQFKFSIFLFVQFMITGVENSPFFNVNYMLIWISIGIVLYEAVGPKKVRSKIISESMPLFNRSPIAQ